jgi:hypothetical protein
VLRWWCAKWICPPYSRTAFIFIRGEFSGITTCAVLPSNRVNMSAARRPEDARRLPPLHAGAIAPLAPQLKARAEVSHGSTGRAALSRCR